ncbi:hypothetical protein BGZ72_001535 [Mortierella alpina]|nr:hypothetical protein BGZ72_001535 [Mortierella alpina]
MGAHCSIDTSHPYTCTSFAAEHLYTSSMPTVPQDPPAQERQPLLQAHETGHIPAQTSSETVIVIQDQRETGHPSQGSLAKVDRLQHHREMVRERFSVNWWLEWTIIIVSRAG